MARNLTERMRRTRINDCLMELASLLPSVKQARRKLDKTSILRLTVNFLHQYHYITSVLPNMKSWHPYLIDYQKLNCLLLESLNGFLLLVNDDGMILFCSEAITTYLGFDVVDVLGQPVSRLLHPEDEHIFSELFHIKPEESADSSATDCHGYSHSCVSTTDESSGSESSGYGRNAYLRMVSHSKGPMVIDYEPVQCTGRLKELKPIGDHSGEHRGIRRVLICVVRLVHANQISEVKPITDLPTNQWISWHQLDGSVIDLDSRGTFVLGYLVKEVRNLSAYEFIVSDDIPFAMDAHAKVLHSQGAIVPKTILRVRTNNQLILFTHISSHLVSNPWTKGPRFMVSVNTVLSLEDGERLHKEQEKRRHKLKRSGLPNAVDEIWYPESIQEISDTSTNQGPSELQETGSLRSGGLSCASSLLDQPSVSLAPSADAVSPTHDVFMLDDVCQGLHASLASSSVESMSHCIPRLEVPPTGSPVTQNDNIFSVECSAHSRSQQASGNNRSPGNVQGKYLSILDPPQASSTLGNLQEDLREEAILDTSSRVDDALDCEGQDYLLKQPTLFYLLTCDDEPVATDPGSAYTPEVTNRFITDPM